MSNEFDEILDSPPGPPAAAAAMGDEPPGAEDDADDARATGFVRAHGAPERAERLRAYQEELSDRLREEAGVGAARQARLGVQIGSRYWLVDLAEAGEIVAVPPTFAAVPMTQSWLRGIVNLRGALYVVSDLAEFLGEAPTVIGRESRLLVFADRINLNAAVLVDRMLGLQDVALMTPGPAGDGDWIDETGRVWGTLHLQRLALDERFLAVGR